MTLQTKWIDHGDEGSVVVRQQNNVGAIADYCKARHNEGHHGAKDFRLMASIPLVVVEHYINLHGITHDEFMRNPEHIKRIVNSPEFADFRIAPGKM